MVIVMVVVRVAIITVQLGIAIFKCTVGGGGGSSIGSGAVIIVVVVVAAYRWQQW